MFTRAIKYYGNIDVVKKIKEIKIGKGRICILLLLLAGIAYSIPVIESQENPDLIWADEFDGHSLDRSKWVYKSLGPRRDAVNVKESVSLDGKGHLVITTRKQGDKWHTGMISTGGKYKQKFGYFECRVKLQKQEGHWSAFWLRSPSMGEAAGSPKKYGAEIDIFEYLAKEKDTIRHALHWNGYGDESKSARCTYEKSGLHRGWHTFGLEWTKNEYVFYVDGQETWRTKKGVSHRSQFIILSLEVGDWAGDISQANLPDQVIFDYVRVFKSRPKSKLSRTSQQGFDLCHT